MGGPWVLFGQVLGVDRWTSSFSPKSLEGFKTPVWVRMPGLPLYCWSSMNIARMCASIGEPLWLDSATEQIERGLFARACIRLDLSKPLKSGFWVAGRHGRFFQPLEYEGLSLFCFRCRQVGHKELSCTVPAPVKVSKTCPHPSPAGCGDIRQGSHELNVCGGQVSEGAPQVGASPLNVSECVESLEMGKQLEDRGAGPWMLVARRRRSNNGMGAGILRDHSKFSAGPWAKNVKQRFNSRETNGYAAGVKSNKIGIQSQHHFVSPSSNGMSSNTLCGAWRNGLVQHPKVMQAPLPLGGKQWISPNELCWNDNKKVLEERHVQDQEDIGEQKAMDMPHLLGETQVQDRGCMEHWNGGPLDGAGRHFDTQFVGVLHDNNLKLAEPQMVEGQFGVTNMEEGQSDVTNISAMPKDNKLEKLEEATYVGDGQVNEQLHMEVGMEGRQPIFSGFSALPKGDVGSDAVSATTKARSRGGKNRGVKKEKMVCELGPVAPGSRKRRKAQSLTDGGDASPSPPQ